MTATPQVRLVNCWDDGVTDDIRLIEILRQHGATGSFNLNAGLHRNERYSGWKFKDTKEVFKLALPELPQVYAGFTVANHTLTHPWLTRISPEEARQNINDGRDALEQIFGYRIEGFAYPFGDQNAAVREMVRAAGHLYARAVETTATVLPQDDPMDFKGSCHFLAPDFWERFDAVRRDGGVFYFWGHSYELITEDDWRDFDRKIARLGEHGEWVSLPSLFRPA
jgi:peptidoglycan/xylan/chitin deacetylase (PgdA/CDA1 family)